MILVHKTSGHPYNFLDKGEYVLTIGAKGVNKGKSFKVKSLENFDLKPESFLDSIPEAAEAASAE